MEHNYVVSESVSWHNHVEKLLVYTEVEQVHILDNNARKCVLQAK